MTSSRLVLLDSFSHLKARLADRHWSTVKRIAMEEAHCIDDSILYSRGNSQHVQACASDCQARFLTLLAPKGDEDGALCQAFSNRLKNKGQGFPMLYCCGSRLCEMNAIGDVDLDCASAPATSAVCIAKCSSSEPQPGPQFLSKVLSTPWPRMLKTHFLTFISAGMATILEPI